MVIRKALAAQPRRTGLKHQSVSYTGQYIGGVWEKKRATTVYHTGTKDIICYNLITRIVTRLFVEHIPTYTFK